MGKQKGIIRIGTSNVVVPGNKNTFPPAFRSKSRLHYYSTIFNTVELNSPFYKTPLPSTFEKWVADVPDNFRFTIKLSKEITHAKNLEANLTAMDKFMSFAKGGGAKKGCLLIQFPGKITLDYFGKVEQVLQRLQEYDPEQEWKPAVEFRHSSWYTGETDELLNESGATMVLHDMPKARIWEMNTKARFINLRFHGPTGDYKDSYTDSFLKSKATEIKEWVAAGKDVYAYFNNTIGSAFENALTLKGMLE